MDADRFDRLARLLSVPDTRRRLVQLLASLPLATTLAAVLGDGPETTAKKQQRDDDQGSSHRRHRRKAKHRHRTGNNKEHRKGKRKGKRKDTDQGTTPTSCTKRTCAPGSCGNQSDGCGGTMNCGCTGNQLCVDGSCRACDVCLPPGACAFSSVQAAIEATSPQLDTIVVCPGVYVENDQPLFAVTINRSLRLIGAGDGPDPATNTHLRPALTNQGVILIAATAGVALERLRLTGGTGVNGRGLNVNSAAATVIDSTITGNIAGVPGGGMTASGNGSQIILTNTQITGNTGSSSGGIEMQQEVQVTLDTLSRVTGNTATSGSGGIRAFSPGIVNLPSPDNVTGNFNAPGQFNCGGNATYNGPGAICTTT